MLTKSPSFKWPSGDSKDVATIRIGNQELEQRTGCVLVSGDEPGLGRWVAVGGVMPCGTDVEIIKYTDAPKELADQFIVRLDREVNVEEAWEKVIELLRLEERRITWLTDYPAT